MPTIKEIVTQYLVDNNYDGLFNDGECACLLNDLMPCCGDIEACQPGYTRPLTVEERHDFEFVVMKEKQA